MNIQIFGKSKCFDTKKAVRYFKERGIKFQQIDILDKGISKGEYNSIVAAIGGYENLIDYNCKDKQLLGLIDCLVTSDRVETIIDNQKVIKTPIVRNGKKATVGYCNEIWKTWE
ncbi:MAG: ArsC family transcriptional regulator [Anaerovoracaceae bacterium]